MKKFVLAGVLWVIASVNFNACASLVAAETEQTALIFSLPDELLYEICLYLPFKSRLALSCTSQRLHRIANDPILKGEVEVNVTSWTEAPAIVELYKSRKIERLIMHRKVSAPTTDTEQQIISYFPTDHYEFAKLEEEYPAKTSLLVLFPQVEFDYKIYGESQEEPSEAQLERRRKLDAFAQSLLKK